MTTFLKRSVIYDHRHIPTTSWKFGENWSGGCWDNWLESVF